MVWSTNGIVQNETLDWDFSQLEIGSAATPFEWRDYSERLAQCKRYLQVFYNNTTGLSPLAVGQSITTQQAYITLPLDTQLRVPATGITVSAGTHFQLLTAAGLGVASTSVSFNQGTVNAVDVAVAIGTASLIAGNATRLAFTSSVGYLAVTGAQL